MSESDYNPHFGRGLQEGAIASICIFSRSCRRREARGLIFRGSGWHVDLPVKDQQPRRTLYTLLHSAVIGEEQRNGHHALAGMSGRGPDRFHTTVQLVAIGLELGIYANKRKSDDLTPLNACKSCSA